MNSNLKNGCTVIMHSCAEAEKYRNKQWKCASDPWTLGDGTEVIKIEGYSGCFETSKLKEATFQCDCCQTEFELSFRYGVERYIDEETDEFIITEVCGNCHHSAAPSISNDELAKRKETIDLDDLPF